MSKELYSTAELAAMSSEELRTAQANGFVKPIVGGYASSGTFPDPRRVIDIPLDPPAPSLPQDPYAVTAWGSQFFDFVTPSGQKCQMKKLRPEELVGTDLLDKITRLPAFAEEAIQKAEGKPPVPEKMPSTEDINSLLEVLDQLLPMVVVQPKVLPTPKEGEGGRQPGTIYVDDIELMDRVAIMERAVQGVKKMDNFRQEP